jgi:hypothetical protein
MARRLISWLLVIVVAANLGGVLPVNAHNMAQSLSTPSAGAPAPMRTEGLEKISSTSHHGHCPSHPAKSRNDCCCCAVCSGGDLPLPVADTRLTPPAHVERSQLFVAELRIGSLSGRIERPPKANA